MAEFCRQCAEELGFPADFTGLFERDDEEPDEGESGYFVLCETCGDKCFIIDDEGTCGSKWCSGSLADEGTPHRR